MAWSRRPTRRSVISVRSSLNTTNPVSPPLLENSSASGLTPTRRSCGPKPSRKTPLACPATRLISFVPICSEPSSTPSPAANDSDTSPTAPPTCYAESVVRAWSRWNTCTRSAGPPGTPSRPSQLSTLTRPRLLPKFAPNTSPCTSPSRSLLCAISWRSRTPCGLRAVPAIPRPPPLSVSKTRPTPSFPALIMRFRPSPEPRRSTLARGMASVENSSPCCGH